MVDRLNKCHYNNRCSVKIGCYTHKNLFSYSWLSFSDHICSNVYHLLHHKESVASLQCLNFPPLEIMRACLCLWHSGVSVLPDTRECLCLWHSVVSVLPDTRECLSFPTLGSVCAWIVTLESVYACDSQECLCFLTLGSVCVNEFVDYWLLQFWRFGFKNVRYLSEKNK